MCVLHRSQQGLLLKIAHRIALWMLIDQFFVQRISVLKPCALHTLRGANRLSCFRRVRQDHGPVLASKKSRGGECLQFFRFPYSLQTLSDGDERRNHWIERPKHFGHPCTQVRACDGLRRDVASMPMVLVTRMKDTAKIRQYMRTDQCSAIHDLSDIFKPGRNLDRIDYSIDGRKRAFNFLDWGANLKWNVTLRIEGVRSGHPSRHPE